ncbi:ABC transporter permease [Corynebacterium auriscanis]|uniref:ABC transporter permease n=1 Tax=Corynebacterium TaxID=1716 RepID=UPI0008B02E37|nr:MULTISPECIES: ABC transporter permease [Corynebacterium]OFT91806.1 ABC transporter permease [Corynebacterium sp. HMSC28B08]
MSHPVSNPNTNSAHDRDTSASNPQTQGSSQNSYNSGTVITTVAKREFSLALRNKAILITVSIFTVLIIGGLTLLSIFGDKEEQLPTLGLVGVEQKAFDATLTASQRNPGSNAAGSTATGDDRPQQEQATAPTGGDPATSAPIETSTLASREEAEQKVKDGDLDAALIKSDSGYEFITKDESKPELFAQASGTIMVLGQNQALEKLGVTPQQFATAMPDSTVKQVSVGDDSSEVNLPAVLTVLGGVSVMSFFIITFAATLGGRVTEEKSSRVVEIILASVRPLDFLAGKLVGNTLFGLLATAALLVIGFVGVKVSGVLDGTDFDIAIIPLMLLAFILGMLLFGSLYSAAGAMVSRTEDLQSTQGPIMILMLGMVYAPMFGFAKLDSTVMQVLAWIPPFSLTVAPLQMAGGNMPLWQVLASFAIALLATIAILMLVARIYRRAILHNGTKLTWMKALRA